MARQPRTKKPLTPAQVEALDRDDNGEAGGSKPKPKLTDHELTAICAEAYEAYDFQDERVRFDTLGRRWQFRPDKIGPGESVLSLEVKLLESVRTDTISTALLASDIGRDMVSDVVARMAEGP
jgi:hypothetical protein